jgi:hypothetical protein
MTVGKVLRGAVDEVLRRRQGGAPGDYRGRAPDVVLPRRDAGGGYIFNATGRSLGW